MQFINEGEMPYYNTFSGAVAAAQSKAEDEGYTIDDDDWWSKV